MLRRSFLSALGLAPAALIPAQPREPTEPVKDDLPLIECIVFTGTLKLDGPCRVINCTSIGNHDAPFRIVSSGRA